MTKYVITSDNCLYRSVKTREDFAPDHKFMNKIDGARIDKIFSNPITAIVYDYVDGNDLRTEYDKKDIIRALDFWISDKVLQNEKLLKLHNRLEDFHETELKSLIRIKEAVLKLPNDTKFKRFIDDSTEQYRLHNVLSSDTVEFWYEIKNPPPQYNPPLISSTETMTNRTIPRTMSGRIINDWIENFTDDGGELHKRALRGKFFSTTEGEFHPSTLLRDLFTDRSTTTPPIPSSTVNHLNAISFETDHYYRLNGNHLETDMTEEEIRHLEWRLNRTLPRPQLPEPPSPEEWKQPISSTDSSDYMMLRVPITAQTFTITDDDDEDEEEDEEDHAP